MTRPYLVRVSSSPIRRQPNRIIYGSAVFIAPTLLLTCRHVVRGQDPIGGEESDWCRNIQIGWGEHGDEHQVPAKIFQPKLHSSRLDGGPDLAIIEIDAAPRHIDTSPPAWLDPKHVGLAPDALVTVLAYPNGRWSEFQRKLHAADPDHVQVAGTFISGSSGGVLKFPGDRQNPCFALVSAAQGTLGHAIGYVQISDFLKPFNLHLKQFNGAMFDARLDGIEPRYLEEIERSCQSIKLANLGTTEKRIKQLRLKDVYITLDADATTIDDRIRKRNEQETRLEGSDRITPSHASAIHGSLELPDARTFVPSHNGERIEEAFASARAIVILGDAGCGKSVLCRYLALQLARDYQYRPKKRPDWIGTPRIPILVRGSRFAEYLSTRSSDPKTLLGYVERYPLDISEDRSVADQEVFGLICRKAIEQQRAVLLLDGLDEVVSLMVRRQVRDAVESFLILPPHEGGVLSSPDGNKLLLTSRTTGYGLAAIELPGVAHFQVRPLDDDAVMRLSLRMGDAYDSETAPGAGTGAKFWDVVNRRSETEASIRRLKRTPLLLTSLFIYYAKNKHQLPQSRAELFERLTEDLAANWRIRSSEATDVVGSQQAPEAWQHLREWLESPARILDFLGDVASRMHDLHDGERLSEERLETILESLLRKFGIFSTDDDKRFLDCSRLLMWLVRDGSGLLIEQGTDSYAFLHLSFREYLVARSIVGRHLRDGAAQRRTDAQTGSADFASLLKELEPHLTEPKWKEPLLFLYSILSDLGGTDEVRAELLRKVRDAVQQRPVSLERTSLSVDLIREVLESVSRRELAEFFATLMSEYRRCGPARSTEAVRWRLEESLAELRRGSTETKAHIDDIVAEALQHDRDPSAVAYILNSRGWWTRSLLKICSTREESDSADWRWPITVALRQSLPGNRHLTIEPAQNEAQPNTASGRRRYQEGIELWQQKLSAHNERQVAVLEDSLIPLKQFLLSDPNVWRRVRNHALSVRLVLALTGCVDDLEAIRWSEEYHALATFLTESNPRREHLIDIAPEQFVWRWGVGDIVYSIAVYLDKNTDRKNRALEPPTLHPQYIALTAPPELLQLLSTVSIGDLPSRLRQFPTSSSVGLLSRALEGEHLGNLPEPQRYVVQRSLAIVKDAAYRGFRTSTKWLGLDPVSELVPVSELSDFERSLLFRYFVDVERTLQGPPLPAPAFIVEGSSRFCLAVRAFQWASGLSRAGDDPMGYFAQMLAALGPTTGILGPLPLLAQIWESPLLSSVKALEHRTRFVFWGISEEERIVPAEARQALRKLAHIADGIFVGFGDELSSLFRDMNSGPGDGDNESSGTIEAAQELDSAICEGSLSEPEARNLIEGLYDALVETSPVDAALLTIRVALCLGDDERIRLFERALDALRSIGDAGIRSEILFRLRFFVVPARRLQFDARIQELLDSSSMLSAYAMHRVGSYLCRSTFSWNRSKQMLDDDSWIVVSTYCALQGMAKESPFLHPEQDSRVELNHDFDEDVSKLLASSSELLVECDRRIAGSLSRADGLQGQGSLLPHLVPLLVHPTRDAEPIIQDWLLKRRTSPFGAQLATQAALMLSEPGRVNQRVMIAPILRGAARGDDLTQIRCEIALCGPVSLADRLDRGYSLSCDDPSIFILLARVSRALHSSASKYRLARLVSIALSDWSFDSAAVVSGWVHRAQTDGRYSRLLHAALDNVDVWNEECLHLVARWVSDPSAADSRIRTEALVGLASRLAHLKLPTGSSLLLEALNQIPMTAPVREWLCFPGDGRKSVYEAVVGICREASRIGAGTADRTSNRLKNQLNRQLVPLFAGEEIRLSALESLGSLRYCILGEVPEDCAELVQPELNSDAFCRSVVAWLDDALTTFTDDPFSIDGLNGRTLEVLLSIGAIISAQRPELIRQGLDSHRVALLLARICVGPYWQRSKLASLTIMASLPVVDLSRPLFQATGAEQAPQVLDGLLTALASDVSRVRALAVLNGQNPLLRPGSVLARLRELQRDPMTSGSRLVAVAHVLRALSASPLADRASARRLLQELSDRTSNGRPWYQSSGSGTAEFPLRAVPTGVLSVELRKILEMAVAADEKMSREA